jgi:hypothetical protein
MKSLADGLPPEIAQHVHPDWRKNEAGYWIDRVSLLEQYRGKWIAFSNGRVIASSERPVLAFQAAQESGEHPFVVCVGREEKPYRIRRTTFAYDSNYDGEALPVLKVEFRKERGVSGTLFDYVTPDTGSDTSVLPWDDCQALQLDLSEGIPGMIRGVAEGAASTVGFFIWIHLDGQECGCQRHMDFFEKERILGRDVLNSFDVFVVQAERL